MGGSRGGSGMLGAGIAIALERLLARPISYYISRDKQRRQQHQTRPTRSPLLCGMQLLYSSYALLGHLRAHYAIQPPHQPDLSSHPTI